ncbi:transposase [Methanosarcina sp. UBA5]|uniref:transposase n=1 Tax=Methanosarcina sp. UBA5 TaxID=1915593 RepID=UPI0037445A4C
MDTEKKVIIGFKISKKTDHEIKHANALIKQVQREKKAKCYLMDKRYDSEKLHSFIREEIKVNSVIPVKKRKRTSIDLSNFYCHCYGYNIVIISAPIFTSKVSRDN